MEKGHHHDDKGCDDTMETTTICEFNEGKHHCRKCVVSQVLSSDHHSLLESIRFMLQFSINKYFPLKPQSFIIPELICHYYFVYYIW